MNNTFTSPFSGKVYSFSSRPENRTVGFDSVTHEPVMSSYFVVDVFDPSGQQINFGFVNDSEDSKALSEVVEGVVEWHENPNEYDYSIYSSRFD